MNQKGISPLSLLFIVVIGIFIMWEFTQTFTYFSEVDKQKKIEQANQPQVICESGEEGNCNDSNDVFLLP